MFDLAIIKLITAIFVLLYIPRMHCWFASIHEQEHLCNVKDNKLALMIPARNEGKTILPLLASIKKQTYANKNFDVFIIVKEHDDPVIEYAKKVNAKVYIDSTQSSKGDCLDYCIQHILHEYPGVYDGYILVDADCVLDNNFMLEMNNALASGADVINAKKLVKNYLPEFRKYLNLVTACNGLIWTIMDDMGNRWKSDHGYTTMTITTGIMFSKNLIQKWGGWNYRQTLTEDMELQRDCALMGYKTLYYSHAKFYMEESPSLKVTNTRRNRWMNGLINSDYIYGSRLLHKRGDHAIRNNYFMFCLWLVYAYIGLLFLLFVGNLGIAGYVFLTGSGTVLHYLFLSFYALASIYISFMVLTFAAIIVDWKNIQLSIFNKLLLLLVHPLFYMGYLQIVSRAIFIKKPLEWEVIERVET
jgi:cellulose synthase/poly-beta-1,6-N-acetylglucosamine synthase-like glycosyltransferase